jgi:aspartyl-tRNA(Asn)/glutamyl-tRNA(Gln) amidotransferase subunit B
MEYDIIICFETHVELATRTKLFCDCSTTYGAAPNSQICPVCTGQPGALPVLNKKAVEYAVRAGLALNCSVNRNSRFARKNYFYPDLPKGYQISQYELPLCENGHLEISGDDGRPYLVGIKRIHLEEDAGKLVHSADSFEASDYSFVDYNRSSVPLLEIVGDHERNPLRSLREARAYLEKLRQTLQYIEVSDCSMEKGQLRCDVNISIRPVGTHAFGNRAEIKNMASFKFILEALDYEVGRQARLLESGEDVPQETRLFDEAKRITLPMRSKEDAPDYRYFPDPDLVEIDLDQAFLDEVTQNLPELPDQSIDRLVSTFGVPKQEALILARDRRTSEFFERSAQTSEDPKTLSRWIIKDLFKMLNAASLPIEQCPVEPAHFATLVNFVVRGEITDHIGRTVLEEMFANQGSPQAIIEERGLRTIQDEDVLGAAVDEVIAANPAAVAKIKGGEAKPVGFLVGQVMKKTAGKADPKRVNQLIQERLEKSVFVNCYGDDPSGFCTS